MELGSFLTDALSRPKLLLQYKDCKKKIDARCADRNGGWQTSPLNPKNRLNSLGSYPTSWRIDGATEMDTRFFAIPLWLPGTQSSRRIDVFLSDQDESPQSLSQALELNKAVACRDLKVVPTLGIYKYVAEALTHHCKLNPEFAQRYPLLPFGSSIIIESLGTNLEDTVVYTVPAYELERKTKTISYLQKLWAEIPDSSWPAVVDIGALHLVEQLHDSISVVELHDGQHIMEETLVFKSNTNGVSHLYHELHFLLCCPPHPNLISKPLHVVTSQSRFGGKCGVVGFTLKHYSAGSISNFLAIANKSGKHSQQLRWCQQIASGVMHAHLEAHFFLSDLRPDNILLDRREREDGLVICDFEQRGNWYEWSPPEILYAQYVENIEREMQRVEAGAAAAPWRDLVALYRSVSLPHKRAVCGKVEDSNWPWFVMTAQQQEKAQVYMIGLLIYCIFEGTSNVRLNIANAYRHEDPEIQFPTFKNSPMLLRKLIQKYTAGAPEWEPYETHPSRDHSSTWPPRATRVIRNGTNLQTEASAGAESNLETEHDVLETALNWWAVELQRAKHFFTTHGETYRDVGECRPTLKEVLLDLQCLQLSELE